MSTSTGQNQNEINSLLCKLSVQRNLVRNLKKNVDNLSMTNLALRQDLEVCKHELLVKKQQMDILKDTAGKLQSLNVDTTLDQKVAYEAKEREALALRELNLQFQADNMKLHRQLEEAKGKNISIMEGVSKLKERKEERDRKMSSLNLEFGKLAKNCEEVLKKCDELKGQDQNAKIVVEYQGKICDILRFKNKKLMEENMLLSSEIQMLRKNLKLTFDPKETEKKNLTANEQAKLKYQEEINRQIEINNKLQLALTEAIDKSKKLNLQKQELEAELKKNLSC